MIPISPWCAISTLTMKLGGWCVIGRPFKEVQPSRTEFVSCEEKAMRRWKPDPRFEHDGTNGIERGALLKLVKPSRSLRRCTTVCYSN